jgi:hypothetical protein
MEGSYDVALACCALRRWGMMPGEFVKLSREEKAFIAAFIECERENKGRR